MARLQRMETSQATALDIALAGLHSDLVTRLDDLRRLLDLMPGPASRSEIVLYLRTLRDWLNTDPWPQDGRFGGPELSPASIERKLQITVKTRTGAEHLDADELTQQCERLVILGGPGSGKTWLARRTARRCADTALAALTAGAPLDEVELRVYDDLLAVVQRAR